MHRASCRQGTRAMEGEPELTTLAEDEQARAAKVLADALKHATRLYRLRVKAARMREYRGEKNRKDMAVVRAQIALQQARKLLRQDLSVPPMTPSTQQMVAARLPAAVVAAEAVETVCFYALNAALPNCAVLLRSKIEGDSWFLRQWREVTLADRFGPLAGFINA
eukprot:6191556-Pleurochrysis_carterae.AAC.2